MFAGVLNFIADTLDSVVDKLPGLDLAWLSSFSDAMRTLTEWVLMAFELFPPLETAGLILVAYVAFEAVLIAFYWLNWLLKKIPFIGG